MASTLRNNCSPSLVTYTRQFGVSLVAIDFFVAQQDFDRFVFLEVDPHKLIVLQDKVKGHVTELLRHIQNNLSIYGGRGVRPFSPSGVCVCVS
jgi:hypothetical protein